MLMLAATLMALLLVPVLGGRLGRLAEVQLSSRWLVVYALFLQVLVISIVRDWPRPAAVALHASSYVIAGAFVWLNRDVPGLPVLAVGAILNALAIAVNGGERGRVRPLLTGRAASGPWTLAWASSTRLHRCHALWPSWPCVGEMGTDMTHALARDHKHLRADRARHFLLGSSLVTGPALLLAASVLSPSVESDEAEAFVAAAASESTMWQVANVVELLGFMLLVPAIIAAAELIRSRFPGLALATVALVSTSAMMIVGAIFYTMMMAGAKGLDEAAIAEYFAAGEELGGMLFLLPLFFVAAIGYLFLAYGLWQTRATARWVPALFVASFIGAQFTSQGSAAIVITNLGMLIASAGMAWAYLIGEEDPAPEIAPRMREPVPA
jgi:hypothetical protein